LVPRHIPTWADDVACLICLFRQPAGRPAEEVQSKATGLSKDRLKTLDALVTEEDVKAAPPEKRATLSLFVGHPLCSVVQHAVAQKISLEQQAPEFEPSIPFVACSSACMVMAEALAYLCGWGIKLEPPFQFDFLLGPTFGLALPQFRRQTCICDGKKNIEKVRAMHGLVNTTASRLT
jgi:hypothetical protein